MLALVLGKCQNSNMKNTQLNKKPMVYVVTNVFGEKQKLKIGDKVSQVVGCTYSWNDQGVILAITKKKWLPYLPASNVAKIKNLAGDIFEVELDYLRKR
jgi:hypothetical protein